MAITKRKRTTVSSDKSVPTPPRPKGKAPAVTPPSHPGPVASPAPTSAIARRATLRGHTAPQSSIKDSDATPSSAFSGPVVPNVQEEMIPLGVYEEDAFPKSAIARRAALRAQEDLAPVATEAEEDENTEMVSGSDGSDNEASGSKSDRPRTPGGSRKRKARRERASFMDEECVSNWLACEDSDGRNFASLDGAVYLGLKIGETIIPRGTLRLEVLKGAIEMSGAIVLPSTGSVDIFAPASHALPVISAVSTFAASVPSTKIRSIPLSCSDFDVIFMLLDLHTGIEDLDLVWSLARAKSLWTTPSIYHATVTPRAVTWDLIWEPTPDVAASRRLGSWEAAMISAPDSAERLVNLIEGPKRVGKSTFSMQLAHRLLSDFTHVAILDLDPGQPLFSPPSTMSLHVLSKPAIGPSYARHAIPVKSHFLGAFSPKDDPGRYLAIVEDLAETYRTQIEFPEAPAPPPRWGKNRGKTTVTKDTRRRDLVPLIVNTMGWNKGMGADLLMRLRETVSPTHVFAFESDALLEPPRCPATLLEPIGETPLSLRLTAADSRALTLLSYFYAHFPKDVAEPDEVGTVQTSTFADKWDFGAPLVEKRPYAVSWSREDCQILGVQFMAGGVDPNYLGYALNGTIVGIVASSVPSEKESESPGIPYEPRGVVSPPSTSSLLGLALVRSLDPSNQTFHLLTPVPASMFASQPQGVLLVKGVDPDLPVIGMLERKTLNSGVGGVEWETGKVPFLSVGGAGVGGEKKRVRRNVMRRGQSGR